MNDHESSDSSSDEFYEKIKAQLNIMDDEEKSSRIVSRNEVLPKVAFAPPESKEQREFNFNYKHSDRIQLIGKIESITKENVIIYSNLLEFVINLDQLIVNGQQEILGKVDDVFGKVERPHYSILLDGYVNNLIQTNQLKIGDDVFINIDSTSVLNPDAIKQLLNKKGCDASNQFDEEVLNDCDVEYSDDEIEAVSKRRGNKEEGEVKKNNKKKEKHPNQQKHDKQLPFPQQNYKVQGNNQQTQQQQQQQQMMQMQHSMQQQQYYQQLFLQQQMQLQMQQQQQYQQLIQNQQAFPQQQMQQPQYMQQIYPQPQQLQPNPQLNLPYNSQQINQQLNQNLNSLFQNIKPQDQ
ncbi:unnamed protein product [Paramecium octaurelia]|uniref:H/ACA ribonucleoprotein complex subunit n=1 Tax=Paramecium octaurelia TaxID=43137 RepID=A0A8S1T7P3_PAROT|nr:unnamed protein product [Paramecium octaurelia]